MIPVRYRCRPNLSQARDGKYLPSIARDSGVTVEVANGVVACSILDSLLRTNRQWR